MSTVGNKGKGESIWLGWFIYLILNRFIPLCELKKDTERAENYKRKAEYIRKILNQMVGMVIGIGGHILMMEPL